MDEKFPLALPKDTILAGQYVITRVLGQGGFGITYEATDHKTGQKVAVKEFFPDTMATRTQTTVTAFSGERGESFVYGKDCFLQEAETLAQFIGNKNIVRVHSYFEENGTAYFVMDFIEGTSFDVYIKEHGGRVSYEEAEKILLPVMDALAAVHSKGIVHRDVTPDNIYITKDGTVKLLDFGAARYSLGDKSRSLDVVLKHGFAPKEQYTRHGKQGPFTDVYSVGATFYFAITGRRPPDSIDRLEEDELIPPSSLGIAIPPAKEDAILKAMSVQPADRYPNMIEFIAALAEAPTPQPVQTPPEPAVQQRYFTQPEPVQPAVAQTPPPVAPQPVIQQPAPEPVIQQPEPEQPTVVQTPPEPVQQKNPKRWILPVGIGACLVGVAAIITGIVIASGAGKNKDTQVANYETGGGGSSYHESQDTTEKSGSLFQQPETETTEPETEVSGRKIVGNDPNNILNNANLVVDGTKLYMYYPGEGLICTDGDNSVIIDKDVDWETSLSIVGDYVYYLKNRIAYRAKKDGSGSHEKVSALQGQSVENLWVTEAGFLFLSFEESHGGYSLNYVDRSGGSKETLVDVFYCAFMGGYVYYLSYDYESVWDLDQILRVPVSNLEAEPEIVYTFTDAFVDNLRAADGMLYAIDGRRVLFGYDVSSGIAYEYDISNLIGEARSESYLGYSLNVGGGYVYISGYRAGTLNGEEDVVDTASIYRIPVSNFASGSGSAEQVLSTTDYCSVYCLNLMPEEGDMTFAAHDSDWNLVMVIMSMDGSDPVVLGGN